MSDGIVFLSNAPPSLANGSLSSENGIFVLEEFRTAMRLSEDLSVTLRRSGRHTSGFSRVEQAPTIAAGTAIRSYILHVDCLADGTRRRRGRVVFGGEILGVITNPQHWTGFVELSTRPACKVELNPGHVTLVEADDGSSDWLEISEDRRALEFAFVIGETAFDAVRIIVASDHD